MPFPMLVACLEFPLVRTEFHISFLGMERRRGGKPFGADREPLLESDPQDVRDATVGRTDGYGVATSSARCKNSNKFATFLSFVAPAGIFLGSNADESRGRE